MTRKRINWGNIGVMVFGATALSVLGLAVKTGADKDISRQEAKEATTAAVDKTTYSLINSDTIEVRKDDLLHIFNFNFGHIVVIGKVNETKIDAAFTFNQFGTQDHIENVRAQGCAIAATTAQTLANKKDRATIAATAENAALFLKNHCPSQPIPRNG